MRLIPPGEGPKVVAFLLDGSGSVSDDEFNTMTEFVLEACDVIRETDPDVKVSVLQFSNDVREEWSMDNRPEGPLFESACRNMVRMNGGTNISLALQRSGQVLKSKVDAESPKSLVLLTDGRVDPFQAKETRQMASTLADDQPSVTLFAFGVGRGVDRNEMFSFLAAAQPCRPGTAFSLGKSESTCAGGTSSNISSSSGAGGVAITHGLALSPRGSVSVDSYCPMDATTDGSSGNKRLSSGGVEVSSASRMDKVMDSMRFVDLTAPNERYLDLYVREDTW